MIIVTMKLTKIWRPYRFFSDIPTSTDGTDSYIVTIVSYFTINIKELYA